MGKATKEKIIKYYRTKENLDSAMHQEYILELQLRAIGINVSDYNPDGTLKQKDI